MIKNTEEWNGSGYSRIADGCVTFCLGWGREKRGRGEHVGTLAEEFAEFFNLVFFILLFENFN